MLSIKVKEWYQGNETDRAKFLFWPVVLEILRDEVQKIPKFLKIPCETFFKLPINFKTKFWCKFAKIWNFRYWGNFVNKKCAFQVLACYISCLKLFSTIVYLTTPGPSSWRKKLNGIEAKPTWTTLYVLHLHSGSEQLKAFSFNFQNQIVSRWIILELRQHFLAFLIQAKFEVGTAQIW